MKLNYLNYKEPLTKVDEGFGYLGTLAQTETGDEVQCHICGALVENLGLHAWQKHEIKAKEYREKFQLGRRTPLCSDNYSQKIRENKLALWAGLSQDEQEARKEQMRQAQKKTNRVGNPTSLEVQNKQGLCPEQLITQIKTLESKLNKSPTYNEFLNEYNGKYMGAIKRTFGSWLGAKRIAGLEACKTGCRVAHNRAKYSDEELLEYLRSAYKEKGAIPTFGDFNRGFLPSYYLYRHRFGGIQKARKIAGIV